MKPIEGQLMTTATLARDMRALGVREGMTVLVHSSFKSLGSWVLGGPVSVILALEEAIGGGGTLVMPTHSADLSDPAGWRSPPVDPVWWDAIREQMPPYDPSLTPTRMMGIVAETFRKQEGTMRSRHPLVSFAARGPLAERITAGHSYEFSLGERSPLARIYDEDGWVLLLGVGHGNNTSIHLAECRASYVSKEVAVAKSPIEENGKRTWIAYNDIDYDSSDFERIGADFAAETGLVRRGRIGGAEALLMPQRALVDYAVRWLERFRK